MIPHLLYYSTLLYNYYTLQGVQPSRLPVTLMMWLIVACHALVVRWERWRREELRAQHEELIQARALSLSLSLA